MVALSIDHLLCGLLDLPLHLLPILDLTVGIWSFGVQAFSPVKVLLSALMIGSAPSLYGGDGSWEDAHFAGACFTCLCARMCVHACV
jgi:hypothetical protein